MSAKRDLRVNAPKQRARLLVDHQTGGGLLIQIGYRHPGEDGRFDVEFAWHSIHLNYAAANRLRRMLARGGKRPARSHTKAGA